MADYDDRKWAERRNKDQAYCRVGLYMFTRKYGHENFCDVHSMWYTPKGREVAGGPSWLAKSWYSGPNDSIRQIQALGRSARVEAEYRDYREVSPDLEISAGGQALTVEVGRWPQQKGSGQQTNRYQFWLFGPLLLENQAYGSLFFELAGPLRRDNTFRPLQLRGSRYCEGPGHFLPQYYVEANLTEEEEAERRRRGQPAGNGEWDAIVEHRYNTRVNETTPAILPPDVMRWEWRVEALQTFVTQSRAMGLSG